MTITVHRCLRCGHEWPSHRTVAPKICPKCKSPYWNEPRKERKTAVKP